MFRPTTIIRELILEPGYSYILKTNYISTVNNVTATLCLQFLKHSMLFPMIKILNFWSSIFQSIIIIFFIIIIIIIIINTTFSLDAGEVYLQKKGRNYVKYANCCDTKLGMPYYVSLTLFTVNRFIRRRKKPTRCHSLIYCSCELLYMFRALICPSSGAPRLCLDYGMWCVVLKLLVVGRQVHCSRLCVQREGYPSGWTHIII
jgi:hypothetical protein